MRISDWSSDVCSSDLHRARVPKLRLHIAASPVRMERQPRRPFRKAAVQRGVPRHWRAGRVAPKAEARLAQLPRVLQLIGRYRKDRQSAVSGKSVSFRVDIGGGLSLKNKKTKNHYHVKKE